MPARAGSGSGSGAPLRRVCARRGRLVLRRPRTRSYSHSLSSVRYTAEPSADWASGWPLPVYYQPGAADRWPGSERMFSAFGCLVYRYRLIVVAVWAIVVLVAGPIATRVFQVLGADGFSSSELEAARADAVLTQRFGFDPGTLLVVYEDPQGKLLATDPRFQADVEASVAGLRSLPEVADFISPALNPRQLAPDGHAAYVVVTLHLVPADPHPLLNIVTQALRLTELRPTLTGQPVFLQDIFDVTESDLRRAELISFPFAAVALLLVFGSATAAILPGLAAAAAITVTLAAMVGLSKVTDLSIFSLNLATLLGLGLGIDYSLFLVSRFREELGHGKS